MASIPTYRPNAFARPELAPRPSPRLDAMTMDALAGNAPGTTQDPGRLDQMFQAGMRAQDAFSRSY